jgi:hypothetical protein
VSVLSSAMALPAEPVYGHQPVIARCVRHALGQRKLCTGRHRRKVAKFMVGAYGCRL